MITLKKNGEYYEYSTKDFVDAGVLTQDEADFYDGVRIPYKGDAASWYKLYAIQEKISASLHDVVGEKLGNVNSHGYVPALMTDYIAGPGGAILGQHDGKYYDSKSDYYKSLKASGHVIHESGMHETKRKQRGDYNVTKELKEAAQKHGLI